VEQIEKSNVVKVGVLGPRRIEWYEPRYLNGRDPAVFTVMINADGTYIRCGAYCVIAFHRPRFRGPRRPAQRAEEKHFFWRVPRIRAILAGG
jgi:hypothetical protein